MTPTPFCLIRHDRWVSEFLMTLFEPSSTLFNRNIMWQFNGQMYKHEKICLLCDIESIVWEYEQYEMRVPRNKSRRVVELTDWAHFIRIWLSLSKNCFFVRFKKVATVANLIEKKVHFYRFLERILIKNCFENFWTTKFRHQQQAELLRFAE